MSVYTNPPLDDFDDVEVERLLAGDTTIPLYRHYAGSTSPLTAEVIETIRRLAGYGLDDKQISERLRGRLSQGAVLKARRRYGIPNGLVARRLAGAR